MPIQQLQLVTNFFLTIYSVLQCILNVLNHLLLGRMEKVNVRMMSGIVKLVGIAVCMAGGVILAFYKGPGLKPPFHGYFHVHDSSNKDHNASSHKNWVLGCFLLFVTTICWASWLVLQVKKLCIS